MGRYIVNGFHRLMLMLAPMHRNTENSCMASVRAVRKLLLPSG
jgi:hypothetical protein